MAYSLIKLLKESSLIRELTYKGLLHSLFSHNILDILSSTCNLKDFSIITPFDTFEISFI